MAGLIGVLQGATNPELAAREHEQDIISQLARQREQDIEWKREQSKLLEDLGRSGAMEWPRVLELRNELWGDHKGNKELLKENSENVHGIHALFDKVKHTLFPPPPTNPLGTGNWRVPADAFPKPSVSMAATPQSAAPSQPAPITSTGVSFGPVAEQQLNAPDWLNRQPRIPHYFDLYAVNHQTGHRIGRSNGKWYDVTTGEEIPTGAGMAGGQ